MFALITDLDERLAWEHIKLAKFLNEPYSKVKEIPSDEYDMLKRLMEISSLCHDKEGVDVLKLNVRLQKTEPDIDKLRKKLGKEG